MDASSLMQLSLAHPCTHTIGRRRIFITILKELPRAAIFVLNARASVILKIINRLLKISKKTISLVDNLII